MLTGERVQLRPIREADLEAFIAAHQNIRSRGAFFNGGENQDVLIYSLLRTDPRPWHSDAEAPAAAEAPGGAA